MSLLLGREENNGAPTLEATRTDSQQQRFLYCLVFVLKVQRERFKVWVILGKYHL